MMSYRDMTFCSDAEQCYNHDVCRYWFSPKEKEKAIQWWGTDNPPVAFSSLKDSCGVFEPEDETE